MNLSLFIQFKTAAENFCNETIKICCDIVFHDFPSSTSSLEISNTNLPLWENIPEQMYVITP